MGSVYRRGKTYWIKYYKDGKPYRESGGQEESGHADPLRLHQRGRDGPCEGLPEVLGQGLPEREDREEAVP